MKTALILHGIEGQAGIHWQQWLYDELVSRGYSVLMPDLPNPMHPDRKEWLEFVKDLVKDLDFLQLTIIAHSLSVATVLDLVGATKKKLGCLVSVSGFGRNYGEELNSYFLAERKIDFNKVKPLIKGVEVVYGDDDPYVPQDVLKDLADKLGVEPIVIRNGGHLNTDAGFAKFPLLLKLVGEK